MFRVSTCCGTTCRPPSRACAQQRTSTLLGLFALLVAFVVLFSRELVPRRLTEDRMRSTVPVSHRCFRRCYVPSAGRRQAPEVQLVEKQLNQ